MGRQSLFFTMKTITLIFLFLANLTFAQFRSGNIFVTSPVCQYTLSGTYTDTTSGNSGQLLLAYDSALVGWKYLFPDSADVITVCLTPDSLCSCSQECQTQFTDIPGTSIPITTQAQCQACGFTWFFGQCLNGIQPIVSCDSPTIDNTTFNFTFCNVVGEKIITEIDTKLYPIPAQDKFFIQSERPIKNIIIINQIGLIVEQFNPTSNSIDVSKLNSGRYVIILYDGLKEKRFNVIKQ